MPESSEFYCVKCIFGWVFMLTFIPPTIWLSLLAKNQTSVNCSIEDFNVTSLRNTTIPVNSSDARGQSIIYFDLKIRKEATDMSISYSNLNLTFSYVNQSQSLIGTITPIANYTIHEFRQGLDKSNPKETRRKGFVLTTEEFSWEEVSKNAASSSKVVFRVDLSGTARFKEFLWKGNRLKLMAWANVEVNGTTGKKVGKNGIKLKHMNTHVNGWVIFGVVVLVIAAFLSPCWCFLFLGIICSLFCED